MLQEIPQHIMHINQNVLLSFHSSYWTSSPQDVSVQLLHFNIGLASHSYRPGKSSIACAVKMPRRICMCSFEKEVSTPFAAPCFEVCCTICLLWHVLFLSVEVYAAFRTFVSSFRTSASMKARQYASECLLGSWRVRRLRSSLLHAYGDVAIFPAGAIQCQSHTVWRAEGSAF